MVFQQFHLGGVNALNAIFEMVYPSIQAGNGIVLWIRSFKS